MPPRTRKTIDLRAAAARPARPDQVRDLTFEELCRAFLAHGFNGTADLKLRKWQRAFGSHSAWTLQRAQLEHCMEAMTEAGYRPSTINRDISMIGEVFKWARKKRVCPPGFVSPTRGIERLEEAIRVVHLSDDEAKRLLAGAAAFRDRRFHAFVCLLHDSGARSSEVLLRRGRDLDLARGTLVAGTTKTGVPRTLFFSPATAQLMHRVWPKPDPDKLLFEGRAGGPNSFRTAWRNLTTAVGLPGLRMHDLRHVVAQRLLKSGITVGIAQQIMGHSSDILRKRYGHLEVRDLQTAALSTLQPAP